MKTGQPFVVGTLAVVFSMMMPAEAFACPVCFAPGDGTMSRALGFGILALAVVTIGVLGGVGAFLVYLVRRARAHEASGLEEAVPVSLSRLEP
jgi:hypothetical protein